MIDSTSLQDRFYAFLRRTERYTRTDMVYLVRNGFWVNANFVTVSFFALLLSIAFANWLPKTTYGTYQYIFSIYAILTSFTLTGMNAALTQAVARGYEGTLPVSIRPQMRWNMVPALIAIAMAIYYAIAGNVSVAIGIALCGIALPVYNTYNSYTAYLAGKEDFRSVYLFASAINIPYYIAMIASVYFLRDALVLVFVNLFINSAATMLNYRRIARRIPRDAAVDAEAVPYGKRLTYVNMFAAAVSQADNLLVFHFLGAAELAAYALVRLVPERINGVFKSVIAPAFPRLARRSSAEVRDSILFKGALMTVAACAVAGAYALIAPELFRIIYPAYAGDAAYSQIYGFIMLSAVASLGSTVLQAQRKVRDIFIVNGIVPAIQLAGQTAGIIYGGLWGLVFAKVILTIAASIFTIAFIRLNPAPRVS